MNRNGFSKGQGKGKGKGSTVFNLDYEEAKQRRVPTRESIGLMVGGYILARVATGGDFKLAQITDKTRNPSSISLILFNVLLNSYR